MPVLLDRQSNVLTILKIAKSFQIAGTGPPVANGRRPPARRKSKVREPGKAVSHFEPRPSAFVALGARSNILTRSREHVDQGYQALIV